MIEVVIAMFITVVAVLGVFSLVSPAWRTSNRSDYLGRASGILYEEMIRQEAMIMNPCCSVTGGTLATRSVNTGQSGDVQFNVDTTVTDLSTATSPNIWRITVRVTWPSHTGISESLVITRQDSFTSTLGCTLGGTNCTR